MKAPRVSTCLRPNCGSQSRGNPFCWACNKSLPRSIRKAITRHYGRGETTPLALSISDGLHWLSNLSSASEPRTIEKCELVLASNFSICLNSPRVD